MLGKYQSNPGMTHRKVAKEVMRYLQGTKDLMPTYKQNDLLEVISYSDSDFVGCLDSKKSTSNYIFLLAGAISWRTTKQSLVASSTMKAEFVGWYDTLS